MRPSQSWPAVISAIVISGISAAHAQQSPMKYQPMSFDMWCQEQQHLPQARCDKRLPEDDAAFQDYVNGIEDYETQQLNSQAREHRLNQTILNHDPSANPAGTPPKQPITGPH